MAEGIWLTLPGLSMPGGRALLRLPSRIGARRLAVPAGLRLHRALGSESTHDLVPFENPADMRVVIPEDVTVDHGSLQLGPEGSRR